MIREKDGIHIEKERKFVADSRKAAGDINLVSHAHFDHINQSNSKLVCSEETAALTEARTGDKIERKEISEIELIDSGHIYGSKAALLQLDERILYTGDFSPRDRLYIEGFQPLNAGTLIIESTYGIPAYQFPSYSEVESEIIDWIQDNEEPLFLFGYSLGKAQKIQKIVEKATERPILAHGSVKKMNDAVEECSDIKFSSIPYGENKSRLEDDGILIAPTSFANNQGLREFVDKVGGKTAGFSGWAAAESFTHRRNYDRGFPLSDHADFEELVRTVKEVDPERVFTTHGFDEALASHLSSEHGYEARALKKNQMSLSEFS